MRLHRFYINKKLNNDSQLTIDDQGLIHQLRNVFRYGVGDMVVLFDGNGNDYICEIISLDKKEAEVKITEKKKGITPDKEVWLFFSLIKKDNAELILQKCTELGVSNFVPIISERSEKKDLNIERARKILIEASEQCGRSDIPKLHEVSSLSEVIEKYSKKINLIAFDSSGTQNSKLKTENFPVGLLVGPEGGFTDDELEIFKQNNIPVYSLGKLTLRAETAAIAVVSLMNFVP